VTTATLRDAHAEDAPAIAALLNGISLERHGETEVDADEVSAWLREPTIEFVLAERDGELVGYGDVGHDEGRPEELWFDVRHRGEPATAALVMEELERRARSRPEPPQLLRAYADAEDALLAEVFRGHGFEVVRASYRMLRPLGGAVETEPLPEGLELRPYRDEDAEAVYEAHMDSFADHWGFHRGPYGEWRRWTLERPGTDTSLFQLAWAGDALAGISLCRRYSAEEPTRGWVSVLGVRPAWRRRGLARALLLRSFAEFARRGYDSVGLGVDAENTTGAVRLYERAGMHVHRRYDLWERRR
jgi:ribosomal protein S18 acetylase RimI-like enzyme